MYLTVLFLSIILVGIALIAMAIQILFKKDGRFPEIHIEHNHEMQKRGITCAKCEGTGACTSKHIEAAIQEEKRKQNRNLLTEMAESM